MLLYQQIRQYLFSLIEENPQMKRLPSERELLEKFKSTRITVREALIRLESEGVIYRLNRKGWFLSPPRLLWNPIQKVNFYQLAQEQQFEARTQLVSCKVTAGTPDVREAFDCAKSPLPFWQICRVRSLDERPVMVEEIFCQNADFKDLDHQELEGSVTTIFDQVYGVDIARESSRIFVTALPDDIAVHLHANSGASCLKIIRQRFAADNILVDYNIEYWVHGAIEIDVDSQ